MTIAVVKPSVRRMTAGEFLSLPVDEGVRTELVKGEIVVSPRPSRYPNFTAFELGRILAGHLDVTKAGALYLDIDNAFDEENVRAPDIIVYEAGSLPGNVGGGPPVILLCVEVVSPKNSGTDRVDKFKLYESRGVRNYWIVEPIDRMVEAYTLIDGRYVPSGRGAEKDVMKLPPFMELENRLEKLWHP